MVESPREADARRIGDTGHQKQEMLIQCRCIYLLFDVAMCCQFGAGQRRGWCEVCAPTRGKERSNFEGCD
jgi:hypothetical protein